jgi:hypothetical protein
MAAAVAALAILQAVLAAQVAVALEMAQVALAELLTQAVAVADVTSQATAAAVVQELLFLSTQMLTRLHLAVALHRLRLHLQADLRFQQSQQQVFQTQ